MLQEVNSGREMKLLEEKEQISKLNTQLDRVLYQKSASILEKAKVDGANIQFPRSRDICRSKLIF